MQTLLQNVRFSLRLLGRNPGVAITVILTVALGIGANTAIFTVDYATLLAPLVMAVSACGSAGGDSPSALKWSIMTLAIAIRGRASANPQMPNTTPSRIWNANSVAGGISSAWRWMIGVST